MATEAAHRELEVRGLDVADALMLLHALAGLRDPGPRLAVETIALLSRPLPFSSVALTARKRA